jgi:hypothetical protein
VCVCPCSVGFGERCVLRAVQVTARKKKFPLDNMTVETHVTVWKTIDAIDVSGDVACVCFVSPDADSHADGTC